MNRMTEFVRWGVKGAGGLAANLILLTLWVDGLGWPAEFAVFINWALISVAGYVVADRWVFQSHETAGGHARRWLGMESVMLGGKALNYGIYLGLLWGGLDYRIAWTVGAVAVVFVTFAANRRLWSATARGSG